jgi:hypothetical protein
MKAKNKNNLKLNQEKLKGLTHSDVKEVVGGTGLECRRGSGVGGGPVAAATGSIGIRPGACAVASV